MIISICNLDKISKTTFSVNLAATFAQKYRVLIIDTDPSDNSRIWLDASSSEKGLFDLLLNNAQLSECLVAARERLWLLSCGGKSISTALPLTQNEKNLALKLRLNLGNAMPQFDYIIIEDNPLRPFLHNLAILSSDFILITVNLKQLSEALETDLQIHDSIQKIVQQYKTKALIKIVLTDDRSPRERKKFNDLLLEKFGDIILGGTITISSKIAEAPTIFEMRPVDQGLIWDFYSLANQIIRTGYIHSGRSNAGRYA